jgi:hypothetical protein
MIVFGIDPTRHINRFWDINVPDEDLAKNILLKSEIFLLKIVCFFEYGYYS